MMRRSRSARDRHVSCNMMTRTLMTMMMRMIRMAKMRMMAVLSWVTATVIGMTSLPAMVMTAMALCIDGDGDADGAGDGDCDETPLSTLGHIVDPTSALAARRLIRVPRRRIPVLTR